MDEMVKKQYEGVKELKRSDVEELERWMDSQPHLPKATEYHLIMVLYSCALDVEKTKKCLEYYYTIRASYAAIFADRDPKLPKMIKVLETFIIEPLPDLTPDRCGVFYTKLIDPSLDVYDFHTQMKLMDMRLHVWLQNVGCVKGISFIIDMAGSSIRHLHKVGYFNAVKCVGYMMEGLPARLKAVHIVNPTSFVDLLFKLFTPLITEELRSNIHVHHDDSILNILPKNCIPNEFKGTGGTIPVLHENFIKTIQENRDYFIDDEQYKADESKRVKKGLFKRFGF